MCLDPCCNGRLSKDLIIVCIMKKILVLILVVMEDFRKK